MDQKIKFIIDACDARSAEIEKISGEFDEDELQGKKSGEIEITMTEFDANENNKLGEKIT